MKSFAIAILAILLALLVVAAAAAAGPAAPANPTTITVCKQVEDNGDARHDEGGTFTFNVSDQDNTLATPSLSRLENQSGNPPECSSAIAVPGSATQLTIIETGFPPPADWVRNAPGYPKWEVRDGGGNLVLTGSGQTATIAGADFTNLTGDAKITFINRVGRRAQICKRVEDNGKDASNQGRSWQMKYDFGGASADVYIPAYENDPGPTCAPPYDIPVDATRFYVYEYPQIQSAANYPQNEWTTTGGQSGSRISNYARTVDLATTSGDITMTFYNKYASFWRMKLCVVVQNNGDGVNDGGQFNFYHQTTYLDNTEVIQDEVSAFESSSPSRVCTTGDVLVTDARLDDYPGIFLYPDSWTGNAVGTPTWELRKTADDTLLTSGTGDRATVDFGTYGDNLTVVFYVKAGPFGNGDGVNTGRVVKFCKQVVDNGDSVTDDALHRLGAYLVGDRNIIGWWAGRPLVNKTVNEGTTVCGGPVLALNAGVTELQVFEPLLIPNWRGHAANWPQWELQDAVGNTLSNGGIVLTYHYDEVVEARPAINPGMGDLQFIMKNKAAGRKLTFCYNILDNGNDPPNEGGPWHATFDNPSKDWVHVDATVYENGTACGELGIPEYGSDSMYIYSPTTVAEWPGHAAGYPIAHRWTAGGYDESTVLPPTSMANPPYYYHRWTFNFGDPAMAGDINAEFKTMPSRRLQVCKQLLYNGDARDDSGEFTLQLGDSVVQVQQKLTAAEGGAVVCGAVVGVTGNTASAQEIAYPSGWPGNTPGFPRYQWSTTGGQSGSGSGSTVTFDLTDPNLVGTITVTFLNRTGPLRLLTLCKEVADNGDHLAGQGGAFDLSGSTDLGPLFSSTQTVAEGEARKCSPPNEIPPLATSISATETAPGGWPGDETGWPQWTLLNGAGNPVASGTGLSTGALSLASVSGNPTIVFTNRGEADVDFGDAPAGYKTLLADNGARHTISSLYLGGSVGPKLDGTPSANADADPDDDGVIPTPGEIWTVGNSGHVNITASAAGYVSAWVDFNRDGDFADAGENVLLDHPVAAGLNANVTFPIPTGTTFDGNFVARFRIYPASTGGAAAPTGPANGGEVEDYRWSFSPNAVTVNDFSGSAARADAWMAAVMALLAAVGLWLGRRWGLTR